MKQFNTDQLLAYVRKECLTMSGLYEYLDMALNNLTVRQVCEKYNISRIELQWGKHYLKKLEEMLMESNTGLTTETDKIGSGDAVRPFYSKDTTIYDTGEPITKDEVRDNLPTDWPIPIAVVNRILFDGVSHLVLCDEYRYSYKTAWSIYTNVHAWAKYELSGTYVNRVVPKGTATWDEVRLLEWAMTKGFPMDVISAFKDVFNQEGYVHPYQVQPLIELREVMYKENIRYISSNNNKGKVHWGDKWKPFYMELPKGVII